MSDRSQLHGAAPIAGLRSFARSLGIYEEAAIALYDAELRRLAVQARVTRYLSVIAEKRTRDSLRNSALNDQRVAGPRTVPAEPFTTSPPPRSDF